MKKQFIFLAIVLLYNSCLFAQQTPSEQLEKKSPFSYEASYVGDAFYNATGGLKTGGGFLGMGNLKMGFDTEKARLWKGGSFFINGASIHGNSITENYTGDLQVASNIDAGNHVYMHELWFKQQLGNFEFTVGLQDMNVDFMASENGGEYINSSFGVPPVVATNVPAPIFPLTGLGFSAKWNINDLFTWQAVIFDGHQTPFEQNAHNLHWKISKDDGTLTATEFHVNTNIKKLQGTYKLGLYYHSGLREIDEETQVMATVFDKNYGMYVIADQTVFQNKTSNKKLNLFTQLAVSPQETNDHNYYIGFGANYYGLFNKEGNDVLGLAFAHAGLHRTSHKHETTFELFYKAQLTENISIQPDVQYIINPSGTGEKLDNALVGLLRLHINF